MVLPNYRGRFIQGGDNASIIAAGLPNITGRIGGTTGNAGGDQSSGAFYKENTSPNLWWANDNMQGWCRYQFKASRSNSIYGAADTVQPPAIVLIPQIRY